MNNECDVIIIGSGNAALSAGIAASEKGAKVLIIEKASEDLAGGNTKYTAGAMRFAYNNSNELLPLVANPEDPRVAISDFGNYSSEKFKKDLLGFNDGEPLTPEQEILVSKSYDTMTWLAEHGIKYDPIFSRQSFEKDGKIIFWGGLTLAAENEGVGLYDMELAAFKKLGGEIRYNIGMSELVLDGARVAGVKCDDSSIIYAGATILACGGFESNQEMRVELLGPEWKNAKVRGTPHNTGDGLQAAWALGAKKYGRFDNCHATPMDLYMKDYGNLKIPHGERKNYRKISYFLGIMINCDGERFVDEGMDFRNYTYAQFGKAVLEQPKQLAWQFFDAKTEDLLYQEYRFFDASYKESNSLEGLVSQCDDLDQKSTMNTITKYNLAVDDNTAFDPTIKDGKGTIGLSLPKSNWAQKLDTPPFRAYPVTGGITFSYGGLKVSSKGEVLLENNQPIDGLFACGEIVGGVFLAGYPGGSGLTSGAVFGRIAGASAGNLFS
ncbi:MAG: FAD-dependent tricarballylate dehydrogenase TcuA [Amylibacter sp.]|nr:FAD-dependent tricarballylate dehydrogenase TcuA [Amylibacter sp.]|tara:strand:+ start:405 stop:1889 length:1485 start_codon:yes stop_codon:yes gene_type:complete